MSTKSSQRIAEIIKEYESDVLADWVKQQLAARTSRPDLMSDQELRHQSKEFLSLFRGAVESGNLTDITSPEWTKAREFLEGISRSRAEQGFTPSETATFVFSLKQPLFTRLQKKLAKDVKALGEDTWTATVVLDRLGLYAMEVHQQRREAVIGRQQQDLLELSTPVVKLWKGILAVPLIGTLDSTRAQIATESLLQTMVETGSEVAIIDITGVPAVDTQVCQHLIKTAAAARLMGAKCIISGIRPQIAQTIVTLGVTFEMVTKATLAEAFCLALKQLGLQVSRGRVSE
jgi:rsbT co-antagonist protein RsbR